MIVPKTQILIAFARKNGILFVVAMTKPIQILVMPHALAYLSMSQENAPKNLRSEIFEWDTYNWSKALPFWESHLIGDQLECLELGAHRGGPSLWLSLKGHQVLCTDLESPELRAKEFHEKNEAKEIRYAPLDALNIPFENKYDIVIFKSVLGGISRDGAEENKKLVIDQIHKCLKPGGKLLFAENIKGSKLHQYFRAKTRRWGNSWNYLEYRKKEELFSDFKYTEFQSTGFLSAFGPNEFLKRTFGLADYLLNPFIPISKKYILFGVCEK